MLYLMRTAGAEPRLFFATAADSTLRQEIADSLTADGAIHQIPAVITPGEPVPKLVREHKGSHSNNKLFVIEGLAEAITRGGSGFFPLLAEAAGFYTNYGTWCLVWLTDAESRLRVERESARIFQAATYNPTFYTPGLIEPKPGALPELFVPEPFHGDPDGRVAGLSARLRRKAEFADFAELGDELARLGEKESARALFRAVMQADEPDAWKVRAARGLARLGSLPLEMVEAEARRLQGDEAVEAMVVVAEAFEEAQQGEKAALLLQESLSKASEGGYAGANSHAALSLSRLLRRQGKLYDARALLDKAIPRDVVHAAKERRDDAAWASLVAELGRVEMEQAFTNEGSDPSEQLGRARKFLERARGLALSGAPIDYEAAHTADIYLSGLFFGKGDETQALAVMDMIVKRAENTGARCLALEGYKLRMSALFEVGENSQAINDMTSAVKLSKSIGYPDLEADVLEEQASVEERLGSRDKATRLRGEAELLRRMV
jgi:tetratricopeptide (TPR) repeat protein